MTFSIVAFDQETNSLGTAVATTVPCVGALAPHASLVAAVSTQAYVNVDLGIDVMERTYAGEAVDDAIRNALDRDTGAHMRQISGIDSSGFGFAVTGTDVLSDSGHLVGTHHVVAGNLLSSVNVLTEMSLAFEGAAGEEFVSRLIRALEAGLAAGGERSSKDFEASYGSAAALVASPEPRAFHNLRVDASRTAISDLRQVYERAVASTIVLEQFYDGAITIRPNFWRRAEDGGSGNA